MPILKSDNKYTFDISKFRGSVDINNQYKNGNISKTIYFCIFSESSDIIDIETQYNINSPNNNMTYYPYELFYYFYKNILPCKLKLLNNMVEITTCKQNTNITKYLSSDCLDFSCSKFSPSYERFSSIEMIISKSSYTIMQMVECEVCAYIGECGALILNPKYISEFKSYDKNTLNKMHIVIGIIRIINNKYTITGIDCDIQSNIKNWYNEYINVN